MLRGDGSSQATAGLNILGPLGVGGFGAVYEALDTRSGQRVAVKELDDTSADSIARFKHEFRALQDCHHPNLVGLKELIEQNGRWLIVMELVPGMDFLRYVEAPANQNSTALSERYDQARLRTALVGMAEGLRALHHFGIVHRDLKPSNVRVRPDGRAVLLDFGLATSVDPSRQSTHAMGVGTVVYMAPEQAVGGNIGPAADLYALGVCLFEALTGRVPFDGENALKIVLEKQRVEAPLASSLVPDVPPDLDDLCARLLAIDPARRPSADAVLRVLTDLDVSGVMPQRAGSKDDVFAGREAELAHLTRALSRTHESELRVVLVEGESGVGKSELVSEFLRRTRRTYPNLIALRGRCYENEQVSYKAFDGCIDELTRLLKRLSQAECAALLPTRAALLGQLFPVMRNVRAIAQAPRDGSSADPSARRLEAFAALSHLLAKLAEERPVVLVLDDLQWADSESFRLLSALNQQSPRPPILLLGTLRPREELELDVRERLDEVRKWQHTDVVTLFGLPREQARLLAQQLLPEGTPERWLDMIAEESHGHPLFMSELVQYTQSHDFAARGSLTLEAALRSRIDRLDRPARELLELVATAARPHSRPVFEQALAANIDEAARTLLAAKLLRERRGHELGCYHDRIRHAATDLIAKARLPALHHRLATALEKVPDADASEQAHHWDLAGQAERAATAYELAARRALETLAFSRAALLCERAMTLHVAGDTADKQRLTVLRAEALACAGRCAEAAAFYQRAADGAEGDERVRLLSQTAAQLILSARVGQGIAATRSLVNELGYSMPARPGLAILRYLWEVMLLSLRPREQAAVTRAASERERLTLTVMRELLYIVGIVHPLAYVVLSIQVLRRSAGIGDRFDTALRFATRSWFRAINGSLASVKPLLARSHELMQEHTDPRARAMQSYAAGSALTAALDWVAAAEQLELAHRLAQEHCAGSPWLLTSIRYHLGANLFQRGEHAALAGQAERWLAEARERNDPLAVCLLAGTGSAYVRHLMRDAPEAAVEELEQAVVPIDKAYYSFAHFGVGMGLIYSGLYCGGSAALRAIAEHETAYRGAALLRSRMCREALVLLRALGLLSSYAAAPNSERPALLKQAEETARALTRGRTPLAKSAGALALAQLEALRGRREQALKLAQQALVGFKQLQHQSTRAASYLIGLLEGGRAGREKRAAVVLELKTHGWREPLRALSMNLPVRGLLEEQFGELDATSAPAPTLLLGRYQVTGQLGSGGFGSVVSARDVQSGHTLALKELVRGSGASLERFKHEFRALSDLHHENIVQLEALFEHEGRWYIAMELVEGADLLRFVRSGEQPDVERLRRAFLGVARGLDALHQTGFAHRDVKPENVLVTPEGRAVLIDFGLAARLDDAAQGSVVGSLQYAAPEQREGAPPHASADVYALGACLHQALYGRLPDPRVRGGVSAKVPEAPSDISALCARMLASEPSARPALSEVMTALAGDDAQAHSPSTRPGATRPSSDEAREDADFAGREQELARLLRAFERCRDSGMTVTLVQGESGLGKSALVKQFTRRTLVAVPRLALLRSRCYENEQVAFKAFDGAVDQLAQLLRSLPLHECEALLPKRAALLSQLFPVLGSVRAIAEAPKKGLPAEPVARKQAGRECLVQLLVNLGGRYPLLIVVDDLQWADSDSFELLLALTQRRAELPLLVIGTLRPAVEMDPSVATQIEALLQKDNTELIALTLLAEAASASLARRLLGDVLVPERLHELVRESKGHPLFLRELVEHEKSGLGARRGELTLDAALAARIEGMSAEARRILSLVAIADKPYGVHVYARALGRGELPRDALLLLLQRGLLLRRGDKLACYHDRIRHVALSQLTSAEYVRNAGALAAALKADPHADAGERARLWDAAENPVEAIEAYEQAGDKALEGLAFARAERHYARALVLLGETQADVRCRRLMVARGRALARAGRSADAALVFQRAAEHASGEEAVRLRLWAAQHLIQSAQVESGLRAARKLLGELGLSLPESDRSARRAIAWERARVKLRGIELKSRKTSPHSRLVLEALRGLSSPVRAVSMLPGSALVVQYLRRALDAGDPVHAARALAYEAFWRVLNNPRKSQDELFERSRTLAETTSELALIAEVDVMRGLSCVTQLRPRVAPVYLWRAHDLLQANCPGESWLLTAARMYLGSAWFYSGNFREIKRHTGGWIEEARAREDRYAIAALTGFGAASMRHLVDDDPEQALSELETAMAPWPVRPFTTTHLGAFQTTAQVLACYGQGPGLLQYLDVRSPQLDREFLMRTSGARLIRHSANLQAYFQAIESPSGEQTARLVARAQVDLNGLRPLPGNNAQAWYHVAGATLQLLAGRRDAALAGIEVALKYAEATDERVAPGIRYMLGRLQGGESGRALCDQVRTQLAEEGFKNVERALAMRVPCNLRFLDP
jgi:serine/threonine protein kinase